MSMAITLRLIANGLMLRSKAQIEGNIVMSNNVWTLPALTVGTTALQIASGFTNPGSGKAYTSENWHKHASVSIQADPANTGTVFVGDSQVSSTRFSRVLNPG